MRIVRLVRIGLQSHLLTRLIVMSGQEWRDHYIVDHPFMAA